MCPILTTFLLTFLKTLKSHFLVQKGPKRIENETGVVKTAKTAIFPKSAKIDGYASVFCQK